jgi:lipopolysaccharide export system protein LptA
MRINITLTILILNLATPCFGASELKDAPISVDADTLEIIQNQNKAIFSGNVIAKQQDMTLQSDKMIIYYQQQKPKPNNEAESPLGAMEKIEVLGNVRMNTPTESANSDRGLYDAIREKIFLYGNVVLRKDGNVLNGSALQYDMKTGSSIINGGVSTGINNKANGGRVRGLFVPKAKD